MTMPLWFGGPSDRSPSNGGGGSKRTPGAHHTIESGTTFSIEDVDRPLLEAIRADDERAFESLVRAYASDLTRFAYDYVGSTDVAEDLVDDLFVWIWDNRSIWQVHGAVRTYLFGAIRNRALNARRDAAYRAAWISRNAQDPVAAGISSSYRDTVTELEIQELGAQLRAAIDRLSEGRRTAILLRWIQEMSYAEIAEVMGTSVVGVKQQLNRALRDLRIALPDLLK